jgi:hypothetical protein
MEDNHLKDKDKTEQDKGDVLIEEVDLEEYAKKGERPPLARGYLLKLDKTKYAVHEHALSGAEILALGGKTPEKFKLYQHQRGHQPKLIGPHERVDFREHGIERFTTMAKDTTEGKGTVLDLRREFKLPLADAVALPWETVKSGQSLWLLIHEWKLPVGYNVATVSVGLLVPSEYADVQIDMVYFKPALSRVDGKAINALSSADICGESWQRWSRHRTAENPWRPGVDDVASHLTLVDEWLRREFGA